jgi:glycosyltransferase involved in cell wall biosynthesis
MVRSLSSRHESPLVMVVMPAYNAAGTLVSTHQAIPESCVDEVLLVDDGSSDETVDIARTLPLKIIALPHNVGYGGNQKVCYLEALRLGTDVVVMLHPDGQYDAAVIPDLVAPILAGNADLVLGSRMLQPGQARKGGMPVYRFVANKLLTAVENLALGTSASELHTGYRAYSSQFLELVPFLRNSNNFVFDTQMIAQSVAFYQRLVEVPIRTRYHPEASSTSLKANLVYGLATLLTMVRWRLHKAGILKCKLFRR